MTLVKGEQRSLVCQSQVWCVYTGLHCKDGVSHTALLELSYPTPETKARAIQPGSTSWNWWKCRLSSEKCWLHTSQLKKVFLAGLFSFTISKNSYSPVHWCPSQGYASIRRHWGLQGLQPITLQSLHFFTVRFKPGHQKLPCLRSYNTKSLRIMVGSDFFPQNYHQILSTVLCLSKSPMIWYIMPCNFLIIVTCRILPCSTVRSLGLTNTPGTAPNREELGKEWQRKILLKFRLKYMLNWFLEHQCVFYTDSVATVSTAFLETLKKIYCWQNRA